MPLLEFEGCRERVERARLHSKAFADAWSDLLDDDVYDTILNIEDDGTGGIWIEPRYKPLPVIFSLELGELLYQLRGALDACVYGAATRETGQDPPPDEDKLEFPICGSPGDFKKASWKIKPLSQQCRDIIESVQPYKAPDLAPELYIYNFNRTLDILNDWARKDRHRKLHVVGTWASNAEPTLLLPPGVELSWIMVTYDGLLEHDSQIAAFKLDGFTPGANVQAQAGVMLDIAVSEPPPPCADNDTLGNRLKGMIIAVGEIVRGIEATFV